MCRHRGGDVEATERRGSDTTSLSIWRLSAQASQHELHRGAYAWSESFADRQVAQRIWDDRLMKRRHRARLEPRLKRERGPSKGAGN